MKSRTERGILRRMLGTVARDEAGVSIIEVLAATLIFLVLSIGTAQAAVTVVRLAGDQRHRVTALSLAAGEVDLVRSLGDPFKVLDREVVVTVDGLDYTIHRDTSWVTGTGLDIPCGAGGTGNLQYKRVNVRVTWGGQVAPISPVSSDTILAPDGRLNDPTRGTILVAVSKADGTGAGAIAVAITPNGGGSATLDTQPDPTNAEGCTYALQVVPGVYTVALSKSGYISAAQSTSPTASVTVTAGATVTSTFTFDNAGSFGLTFAGGSTAAKATNFETSYVNTYGVYYSSQLGTQKLFPWSSGYRGIAGHYVAPDATGAGGCPVVDPAEWQAGVVGTTALADGVATDPVAATPGGAAAMSVPLPTLQVKSIPQKNYITAVSVDVQAVAGEPRCSVGMTYTFDRLSSSSNSSSDRTIMLPYGTWKLYSSTTNNSTTGAIGQSAIIPLNNVVTSGMVTGNQVTLDPRTAG
ncbi:MAG: hypothetical protein DI534_04455 [Leifsonia xyli]|nr:MAG: hypothetical protein DI534_04455 [Leifsonia xyli]